MASSPEGSAAGEPTRIAREASATVAWVFGDEPPQPTPFDKLQERCGEPRWRNIHAARALSRTKRSAVVLHEEHQAPDTGIVAFGSFARQELSPGSDLDWSLLIDGASTPEHFRIAASLGHHLRTYGFADPGKTGTFGSIVSSHELIHYIGGTLDTNQNFTRRMLLLLESTSLGDDIVRQRVVRGILDRYLVYDPSISWAPAATPSPKVPRFLLNDIVRFWRTMAVDYAAKRWQSQDGWALRHLKLRLSRKLLFAAGLLHCFSLELASADVRRDFAASADGSALFREWIFQRTTITPLDAVAETTLTVDGTATARMIFDAYDEFLGVLADPAHREHLKALSSEQAASDDLFAQVRELGRAFQRGLDRLFFSDLPDLTELMQHYAVF